MVLLNRKKEELKETEPEGKPRKQGGSKKVTEKKSTTQTLREKDHSEKEPESSVRKEIVKSSQKDRESLVSPRLAWIAYDVIDKHLVLVQDFVEEKKETNRNRIFEDSLKR